MTTIAAPEIETPPLTIAESDLVVVGRLKTVAAWLLLCLALVSFAAGTPGLIAAGHYAQLGALAVTVPIVVDFGLVFFSVAAMTHKAEHGRAGVLPWFFVALLSSVSVASQLVHTLGGHGWQYTPEAIIGCAVASIQPLVVLASSRSYETLRFGQVVARQSKRAARAQQAPARAKRPATASGHKPAPASRPASAVATVARPEVARNKPAAAGQAYSDEFKAAAVARLASESQRTVAADIGVGRSTIQNWAAALA